MNYLNKKLWGLPKPKKVRSAKPIKRKEKLPPYIHKVTIAGFIYFKVHIKRQDKSKIKYFKTLDQASMFIDLLRLNPYF